MNMSRRGVIKGTLASGLMLSAGCRTPSLSSGADLIRPPGALPEREFRAACIGCHVCVNLCHTLKYESLAMASGWRNFSTPYVKDMRDYPCTLCMECPKVCPTGALKPVAVQNVRMGMALINLNLCLGWNGDVCLSCSKACPLGAIIFDFHPGDWGNQPLINENCKGCGLCVKHCPVGAPAVDVVTWTAYDRRKSEYGNLVNRVLKMNAEERYAWVYNQNLPKILEAGRVLDREIR